MNRPYKINIDTLGITGNCKSSLLALITDKLKEKGVKYSRTDSDNHFGINNTKGPIPAIQGWVTHFLQGKKINVKLISSKDPLPSADEIGKDIYLVFSSELSDSILCQFYLEIILPVFNRYPFFTHSVSNRFITHKDNPGTFPFSGNTTVSYAEYSPRYYLDRKGKK